MSKTVTYTIEITLEVSPAPKKCAIQVHFDIPFVFSRYAFIVQQIKAMLLPLAVSSAECLGQDSQQNLDQCLAHLNAAESKCREQNAYQALNKALHVQDIPSQTGNA